MLEFKNKMLWLRRAAFVLVIILTASLQNTKGALPAPFDIHAMVLVPLVVSICVYEKSIASLLLGAFAGIMWDMTSISFDGFYTILLAALGFLCSVLITFEMRNNIFSALFLTAAAAFSLGILHWLFFIVIKGYDMALYVYFRYYFTSSVYTVFYTFIFYYIVSLIAQKTGREKKRFNY